MRKAFIVGAFACLAVFFAVGGAGASTPGADVRLTNDCHPLVGCGAGYVSAYKLATGNDYTDATLDECTVSRGRQNEPAVAVDPRNTSVLLGSSNDYCGVYNRGIEAGAVGPIWLGYYRSLNGGSSWTSSLVPGYPDDTSPYAALSQARTASAGDPVIAWDAHGRAFFGSESSGDPAGTAKTFGDEFVARFRNPDGPDAADTTKDGLEYYGTTVVAHGSSAPNLLGVFHDKTAIEADRTGGVCDANVYFSWSRFNGNGVNSIYFVRSTDHGVTFSSPLKLSASNPGLKDLQFPDISVTHNGHVYVTFRSIAASGQSTDAIYIVKSTDCGRTFSAPQQVTTFIPNDAQDQGAPEPVPTQAVSDDPNFGEEADAQSDVNRDCGDFADACTSGYTFFRRDTQVRSTADQLDASHEWIYMVYDATKPGTEASTGTTYGTDGRGVGGQAGTFFLRYDGATGGHTTPAVIDGQVTRTPGVPRHLGGRRRPACDLVGQPERHVLQRHPPDRQLRRPDDGAVARRLRSDFDRRGRDMDREDAHHRRLDESQLRAVRQPRGAVRGRLPVGDVARELRVHGVDGLARHGARHRSQGVAGGRGRDDRRREAMPEPDTIQTKKGPVSFWSGDLCPHDGGIDQNIYGDLAP